MCHLHHLLSSLPWSSDVAEVVVAAVFLEDATHLEVAVDLIVADRVALIRALDNVSIVTGIMTSLRSAERNLVALNGHNWLMLTLLSLVMFMLLQPLSLVLLGLSPWYYHRTSTIDYVSSSSLSAVIQRLMHPLQV